MDILEISKHYPIICATNAIRDSGSTSFLIEIEIEHIVKIYLLESYVLEDLMTDISGGIRKYNLIQGVPGGKDLTSGEFLRSNYIDITQNTYIQSTTVTEILARKKCGLLWCLRTLFCL